MTIAYLALYTSVRFEYHHVADRRAPVGFLRSEACKATQPPSFIHNRQISVR